MKSGLSFVYTAFGMTFQLPFPCPSLTDGHPETHADVIVEEGVVPASLDSSRAGEDSWQAEPGRYLFNGGPESGRFLVEHGGVMLERSAAADTDVLARHFSSMVIPAVLRQHDLLVLHANAAATRDGAVVIGGESGAGKSTTLAALLARGAAMMSDDVTAVRLNDTGIVEVPPGMAQLPLTEDAARGLGVDLDSYPLQPWHRMKAGVPMHDRMAQQPERLRVIFLLHAPAGSKNVRISPLTGAEKFEALQACIYGPVFPEEHPGQFPLFSAVARQVEVLSVQRPKDRWTIDEIADAMLV